MKLTKRALEKMFEEGPIKLLQSVPTYVMSRYGLSFSYYWHRSKMSGVSSPRVKQNRSDSDRSDYLAAVDRAVRSSSGFANFKRDPDYQGVLEHVTKEEGQRYLRQVEEKAPGLLDDKEAWKKNDDIGNPVTHEYGGVGSVSPTTLRYLKVIADLKTYFGEDIGQKVTEIGGGYGGQALVADSTFPIREYKIFDIPEVNKLIKKYLESFLLNGSYTTTTLNQENAEEYDLVISNYAFSELPSHLQRMYIKKILANSKRGYLTMNSGRGGNRSKGKLAIDELRDSLPPFEVYEERPRTAPHNYIIAWDHS